MTGLLDQEENIILKAMRCTEINTILTIALSKHMSVCVQYSHKFLSYYINIYLYLMIFFHSFRMMHNPSIIWLIIPKFMIRFFLVIHSVLFDTTLQTILSHLNTLYKVLCYCKTCSVLLSQICCLNCVCM